MPRSRDSLRQMIREFVEQYGDDPEYGSVIAELQKAEQKMGAADENRESPGRRAAMEAARESSNPGEDFDRPNPPGKGEDSGEPRLPFRITKSSTAKELANRRFEQSGVA